MAGYIEKKTLKSGARYYPCIVFEGKRNYHGSYKTKKNAEAHLRRLETELARGTYGEPKKKRLTFSEWAEIWMMGKEKSLKASSLASYKSTFRLHVLPFFKDWNLSEINHDLITEWVDHMCHKNISAKRRQVKNLSPATVNRAYRYLRACLRTAYIRGHIRVNPCVGIDLPRVETGRLDYLEPSEVAQLLESAEWPERTIFTVLAYSGLRLGEALALRWKHVDFAHETIIVEQAYSYWGGIQSPKTPNSVRAVPLLPTLAQTLEDHRDKLGPCCPDELLFSYNSLSPLDPSNVRKRFIASLNRANLKHVTMHSLRHSFATTLIGCGASIKAVQAALGHSSATMTLDVYSHLMSTDLGDAASRVDALLSDANGKLFHLSQSVQAVNKE